MHLPQDYTKLKPYERRLVREEYVRRQRGYCAFCHRSLDQDPSDQIMEAKINWDLFPGGKAFLKHPVHLQHDHGTGMTEGAVHARCNAFMWQYHGK